VKTLLLAGALIFLMAGGVYGQGGGDAPLLRSLPASAQKGIEKIRNSCKEEAGEAVTFPGDSGLTEFLLGGKRAVMIDHGMICGDCVKGVTCSNRGQRLIEIYRLQGTAWRKGLSEDQFAEDIYLSFEPGGKADGQEFNALVGKLFVGNKGCPTRDAPDMHTQAREARPCVVKWNGTKFVYKPL